MASGSPAGGQPFEKVAKQVIMGCPSNHTPNPFVKIFKACPSAERDLAPGGSPEAKNQASCLPLMISIRRSAFKSSILK
jgi:hypothetical protein